MTEPRSPEYRTGYAAGYAAGRNRAVQHLEGVAVPGERPQKYAFETLAVGQSKHVREPNTRRVYDASRKFAQRHAPSRRFSIRPTTTGCTVTMTV